MMQPSNSSFYLPPQASTIAPSYDFLFNCLTGLLVFCLVLIMAAMVYFVWKYRYRGGEHKTTQGHQSQSQADLYEVPKHKKG